MMMMTIVIRSFYMMLQLHLAASAQLRQRPAGESEEGQAAHQRARLRQRGGADPAFLEDSRSGTPCH